MADALPTIPSGTAYDAGTDDPRQARSQLAALRECLAELLTKLGNHVTMDMGNGLQEGPDGYLKIKLSNDSLILDASGLSVNTGIAARTGTVRIEIDGSAQSGWVLANDGTIGSAASGGTARANSDTETLYTLIWNNISNTKAPIQDATGGAATRGANAAADFANNKRLPLPKMCGRALVFAGSGSGLTARELYDSFGAESQVLSQANLAAHTHSVTVTVSGIGTLTTIKNPGTYNANFFQFDSSVLGGTYTNFYAGGTDIVINKYSAFPDPSDLGGSGSTGSIGSGTAVSIMQPSIALYGFIKL